MHCHNASLVIASGSQAGWLPTTMSTISTALRNFKEPTKEQLTETFFSIPASSSSPAAVAEQDEEPVEHMEINAVLSLGVHGEEESYVRCFEFQPLDIADERDRQENYTSWRRI